MPRIFVSYRRDDSKATTGRIHDRLEQAFGADNIFMDVDNIPPGVDFRAHLQKEITQADVILIIIGQKWASILKQRRNDPNDFVRIELESSLQQQKITIPVLIEGAAMPLPTHLPERVRTVFPYLNAVQVGDNPVFHRDMDRLIEKLQNFQNLQPPPSLPAKTEAPKRKLPFSIRSVIFIVAILLLAGYIVLQQWVVNQQQGAELTRIASTFFVVTPSEVAPTQLAEVPTNALTDTHQPTTTPTKTSSPTPKPTDTHQPTKTATHTPEPTNTYSPTPEPTDTAQPTDTATQTPEPTDTPTNTPSPTTRPTNTRQPTNTPTPEPTDTPTRTPSPTLRPTNTRQPTNTPTRTPTRKPTAVVAQVPSVVISANTVANFLYGEPSNYCAMIGNIPKENITLPIKTVSFDGDYFLVSYNGKEGWMWDASNSGIGILGDLRTVTPTLQGLLGIIPYSNDASRVNLRTGPGTNFSIFRDVCRWTSYDVIGRNASGAWLQVRTNSNETAWILAKNIEVTGDITSLPITY